MEPFSAGPLPAAWRWAVQELPGSCARVSPADVSPSLFGALTRLSVSLQEKEKKPLKEGVQDMLVKHHLFSWDIDG